MAASLNSDLHIMAGRRDDEYMDVDSDSGGSIIAEDRETERGGRAGKSKPKKGPKRKEKGKRKAKEVGAAHSMCG